VSSAELHVRRVVFFVDGPIGRDIAEVALALSQGSVAGIVALPGRRPNLSCSVPNVVFASDNLQETADNIRALGGDIFILAWWPTILPPTFLELGQRMTLNMHPSLLPHCRGKDPNFWALREQRPFGVTIHHVDAGIDTGDIAFQRAIPYTWTDDGQTLYERACHEITELFRDVYPRIIAADTPRIKQDPTIGNFHARRELDPASRIDLDELYTARQLLNLLRARTFPPHPACYFVDEGKTFEVRLSIREKQ
jgi:methionyl-tRNA formyltransferase